MDLFILMFYIFLVAYACFYYQFFFIKPIKRGEKTWDQIKKGIRDAIIIFFLIIVSGLTMAIIHEAQLARNFELHDDARGWFFEIKR